MKRMIVVTLLAFILAIGQMSAASASVLNMLNAGTLNELEDDNYETLLRDSGTAGIVDVGDRFIGVYKVQAVNGVAIGENDPTFTALFLLEALVKNVDPISGAVDIFFGPLQSGGVNAAIAEWNAALTALGVDTTGILPTDDGTMAIVFDNSRYGDAEESSALVPTVADSIDTYTGNAPGTSADLLWEVGFTAEDADGDGFGDLGDEFWLTTGPAGIDDTTSPTLVLANNYIALNVLESYVPGLILVPHDFLAVVDLVADTRFDTGHDVQGEGGFAVGGAAGTPWLLATDTDLYILPIPEPSSLAIAIGLCAIFGAARLRRRK